MPTPTPEVPGYTLRACIGRGSRATVWRAEPDGAPGRLVAVKLIEQPVPGAARILACEATALATLGHPGILQVRDVVSLTENVALVTDVATGGSLADRLATTPRGLDPSEVCELGARLGRALAAAHDADLLHRDVKPTNVLFDREAQPLLADFGTTRAYGRLGEAVGASEYLDPDVVAGRPPDTAADIYALGATLHACLTGAPPDAGATAAQNPAAHDRGVHLPLPAHGPLPEALVELVERAMARDRSRRPASASEMAAELDELGRALRADSGPPPPPRRSAGGAGVLGARPDGDGGARQGPRTGTRRSVSRGLPIGAAIGAAIAIVAVPVVVALTSLLGGDAETTPLPPLDATDAGQEPVEPAGDPRREPPARCAGVAAPGDEPELLQADIDGRGCSVLVAWDGRVLVIRAPGGGSARYELGAERDDVLLFGDWSCDGRDAPALYRPDDGQVFRFDALVDEGERATVTGERSGVIEGVPIVRTGADGCDRIEVAPGP